MTNATTEPLAPSPWQEYLRSARALVADGPDLEARGTLTRLTGLVLEAVPGELRTPQICRAALKAVNNTSLVIVITTMV